MYKIIKNIIVWIINILYNHIIRVLCRIIVSNFILTRKCIIVF